MAELPKGLEIHIGPPPAAIQQIPVFLPGNNRNWTRVDGVMRIYPGGTMTVHLKDEEQARELARMAEEGILLQVSFDYRMAAQTIDKINTRYQE